MNLDPKLDIFKKMDDLFPKWRASKGDKGSIIELMIEAFHLDSKESCKNIITLKSVFMREAGVASDMDEEASVRFNEICMRLDQLYKFFEKCCSEWVLLEDFKECKTCQELFDVLDETGIADAPSCSVDSSRNKSKPVLADESIDSVEFMNSVGDSRCADTQLACMATSSFEDGRLMIKPSWYFRDIENLGRPYYDVIDYPTFNWDFNVKPRLFYIGPGRPIDQIISENEETIKVNKSNDLIVRYCTYTRLCLIKSVLSGMTPTNGFICILPNVPTKKFKMSVDGKEYEVQLHKCKYKCSTPEEQAMVNSGLKVVNKNIGAIDIEIGDLKVPMLFV